MNFPASYTVWGIIITVIVITIVMIVSYLATKPGLSVVIVGSRGNVGGNAEGNVGDELRAVHTLHL